MGVCRKRFENGRANHRHKISLGTKKSVGGPSYLLKSVGGPSYLLKSVGGPSYLLKSVGGPSYLLKSVGGPSYLLKSGRAVPPCEKLCASLHICMNGHASATSAHMHVWTC